MVMRSIEPSRLVLARRRSGFSVTALARECGISAQSIHNYESGRQIPSDPTLNEMARHLGLPVDFLTLGPVDDLPPESVSFRARSKMTSRVRDAALSSAQLSIELRNAVLAHFRVPVLDVPTLEGDLPPVLAADYVRSRWGIGPGHPAPNMVHLLESRGIAVFSLPTLGEHLDAFAFRRNDRPFVLLNMGKTAERGRFDAAHELGHLVLHHDLANLDGREIEREANEFAASFLMPGVGVRRHAPKNPTTEFILREKTRWKVAAVALTYRLHELSLLSDWAYRSNLISLGEMGYRRGEPGGIDRESSLLFAKVLSGESGARNLRRLCSYTAMPPGIIGELTFGVRPTIAPDTSVSWVTNNSHGSGSNRVPLRVVG
jgi:Zn-dependent peptidase ImmA (M78 family)/transcriptional regulator with XRE-family HTH domain